LFTDMSTEMFGDSKKTIPRRPHCSVSTVPTTNLYIAQSPALAERSTGSSEKVFAVELDFLTNTHVRVARRQTMLQKGLGPALFPLLLIKVCRLARQIRGLRTPGQDVLLAATGSTRLSAAEVRSISDGHLIHQASSGSFKDGNSSACVSCVMFAATKGKQTRRRIQRFPLSQSNEISFRIRFSLWRAFATEMADICKHDVMNRDEAASKGLTTCIGIEFVCSRVAWIVGRKILATSRFVNAFLYRNGQHGRHRVVAPTVTCTLWFCCSVRQTSGCE
jgi:hypothetical protein